MGWVGLGQSADGFGWVTGNGPMDNSVAGKWANYTQYFAV